MKIILQTPRLILREFTPEDGALIVALNSDPAVLKYVHELPLTDIETAMSKLTNDIIAQYQQYGYGRWAVHLKDEGNTFIGWCGLKYRPERNEIDLGYRFMKDHWGNGYAFESAEAALEYGFTILNIPVITAMAHIENITSLRILEKCGMQFVDFEEVENCPVKTYTLSR